MFHTSSTCSRVVYNILLTVKMSKMLIWCERKRRPSFRKQALIEKKEAVHCYLKNGISGHWWYHPYINVFFMIQGAWSFLTHRIFRLVKSRFLPLLFFAWLFCKHIVAIHLFSILEAQWRGTFKLAWELYRVF